MRKFLLIIIMFFATLQFCFAQDETIILPSARGVVQNVEYVDINANNNDDLIKTEITNFTQTKQVARIKITSGEFKGEEIITDNMLTGNPNYDIKLKKGTKVILHAEKNGDEVVFSVEDIHRSGILVLLSAVFCVLLIYVGKKKGVCSLAAICITCILIFYFLSPMILVGINPVIGTVLICLASTAVTIYLVGGFNKKSTSAVIGCVLSLICAGSLSYIAVKAASLTGYSNENSLFLYAAHPELNFVSIIISAMMLAALGAVMDVGMSIASTINEIYTVDNTKTIKELFVSGMNVGRDVIGTMANTLILVYLGGALPLILLSSNIDMQKFFNLNQVVTEISSALIGSIAIIICVPITAFVASELVSRIKTEPDFSDFKA